MEDVSSAMGTNPRSRLSIVGLLLFIVPMILAGLRFCSLHLFSQNARFPFRGIAGLVDSHFANYFQDPDITAIILISAVGSLSLSLVGYRAANKMFKLVSVFVVGFSSVIIVLQIVMMFLTKTA